MMDHTEMPNYLYHKDPDAVHSDLFLLRFKQWEKA